VCVCVRDTARCNHAGAWDPHDVGWNGDFRASLREVAARFLR
jgi:hypothetical protein